MSRLTITHRPAKKTTESVPVRTEEAQQLEPLLYLIANMLDARLERGFTGGIMIDRGGGHSEYLIRQGGAIVNGDVPEQRFVDVLVDYTKHEKGRTEVIQKMRKLFSKLERGKPTKRTDRYFSFVSAEKAEQAARLLEEYGFGVKHKESARGIEITALPENIDESLAALKSGIVAEAREAYLGRENADLAARDKARQEATDDIFAFTRRIRKGEQVPSPTKGVLGRDEEFERDFGPRERRKTDPIIAASMVLKTIFAPMISPAMQVAVRELLMREDVVEELRLLPQPKELTSLGFTFEKLTDEEYRDFIKFLRGEMSGEVALRATGREPAWLRKYHEARGGSREAFERWEALSFDDVENLTKIDRGWEATLIRNTDESAAETIAALEQRFPERAITWERTPDEAGKGGHWAITVLAEGERAPSLGQWMDSKLPVEISDNASFGRIVSSAISGGAESVSFAQGAMPAWLEGAIDEGRSSSERIVFKSEFRRALATMGLEIPEAVEATARYGGKGGREEPRRRNEKPTSITFTFEVSNRFYRRLGAARLKEERRERREELAARREREREGRG